MIRTSGLIYAYPGQPEIIFPDFHCAPQEHALILGPSGKGKTTLLHLLGGILSPSKGGIDIGETPLHKLRGRNLDKFRGLHIGIIFQKAHFIKALTALENLMLAQTLSQTHSNKDHAIQLLERLSISSKADRKTYSLSAGEQQRLAIARALINKPEVILADEPSSSLDDENCFKMIELLRSVSNENNANLIIVTHDNRIRELIDKKIYLS